MLTSTHQIKKSPTGIQGLDEILDGGLPTGRPTLVCGSAGCGKTLLAMEFLVRGAMQFNEPGVFMAFEENAEELTQNVASLGFDLKDLTAKKKISIDYVYLERSEVQETGEYDLEGLFIRLGNAIDAIHAKRVVLDTIETLFGGLPNPSILRAELRRLFRWLKAKGVTAVITGERGDGMFTRQGLEEYVSDCVILLDHRVNDQNSIRRLRVVKYRGSTHGTNEYPFLIDETGFSVLPVTSLGLKNTVSSQRIASGIPHLDAMLGGKGYFRGSTVLVSGMAGSGKSSISALFAEAACQRGERVLYFAFEESQNQIIRNMRSIGIDLARWIQKDLLQFQAVRPTFYGLEMHLSKMHKAINTFKPQVVIVDPINSFILSDNEFEVKAMLLRLIDFLKINQITTMLTSLSSPSRALEQAADVAIFSLVDTWLLLRDIELGGERNRVIQILKSRGMAHSNQLREFLLTDHGVELRDAYIGESGVLTGSARLAEEARERASQLARQQETKHRQFDLERKRQAMEAQIAMIRTEFKAEESEMLNLIQLEQLREARLTQAQTEMSLSRKSESKKKQGKTAAARKRRST